MNNYENHGKLWTNDHYADLFRYFTQNISITGIARELGRQRDDVRAKLSRANLADEIPGKVLARADPWAAELREYYHLAASGVIQPGTFPPTRNHVRQVLEYQRAQFTATSVDEWAKSSAQFAHDAPNTDKDTDTMQFTIQHLLNGRDIATMSDDEIFRVIAQTEAEIDKLDQIKTKPTRLVKLIEQKRADLAKLIDFLNAQDEAAQAA